MRPTTADHNETLRLIAEKEIVDKEALLSAVHNLYHLAWMIESRRKTTYDPNEIFRLCEEKLVDLVVFTRPQRISPTAFNFIQCLKILQAAHYYALLDKDFAFLAASFLHNSHFLELPQIQKITLLHRNPMQGEDYAKVAFLKVLIQLLENAPDDQHEQITEKLLESYFTVIYKIYACGIYLDEIKIKDKERKLFLYSKIFSLLKDQFKIDTLVQTSSSFSSEEEKVKPTLLKIKLELSYQIKLYDLREREGKAHHPGTANFFSLDSYSLADKKNSALSMLGYVSDLISTYDEKKQSITMLEKTAAMRNGSLGKIYDALKNTVDTFNKHCVYKKTSCWPITTFSRKLNSVETNDPDIELARITPRL